MAKKKKHHDEHPDERWLLTYADMITLLMALFMVLYAMSMVNKVKFVQLKITLKQAFSSAVLTGGQSILDHGATQSSLNEQNSEKTGQDTLVTDVGGQPQTGKAQKTSAAAKAAAARLQTATQESDLRQAQRHLQALIDRTRWRGLVNVIIDERGLVIRLITDKVLFAPGSWQLQPPLEPLLGEIARTIDTLPNHVRVEGNTDGIPYAGPGGMTNDELSTNRAWAVYHYLAAQGFDADGHDTEAAGWGARFPLDGSHPNSSATAQPKNRRVEIVLLREHFLGAAAAGESEAPTGPVGAPISPSEIASATGSGS